VSVVCCQVVSATSWSLIQRNPTYWVRRWVWSRNPHEWGGPVPLGAVAPKTNKHPVHDWASTSLTNGGVWKCNSINSVLGIGLIFQLNVPVLLPPGTPTFPKTNKQRSTY
jgi:hypothetical protein